MRPIALALVTAALAAAAGARPAFAQAAAQADVRRADVTVAAARVVATYQMRVPRADLPVSVMVADSAGDLVASYRVAGDAVARPLAVTVNGTDLVLRADTPSGPLAITLDRQNGDGGPVVTGRWFLGRDSGALHGRVRR